MQIYRLTLTYRFPETDRVHTNVFETLSFDEAIEVANQEIEVLPKYWTCTNAIIFMLRHDANGRFCLSGPNCWALESGEWVMESLPGYYFGGIKWLKTT